jgi:hypothetical protein
MSAWKRSAMRWKPLPRALKRRVTTQVTTQMSRLRALARSKLLRGFGGPGRVRTDDLFHAMEDKPSHLRIAPLKTKNLENSGSLRNRSWHYRSIGETAPDRSGFFVDTHESNGEGASVSCVSIGGHSAAAETRRHSRTERSNWEYHVIFAGARSGAPEVSWVYGTDQLTPRRC